MWLNVLKYYSPYAIVAEIILFWDPKYTVEFAYNGTSGGFLKPAVIAEFTL